MLEDNLSGKIYDMVKIKLGRGTYTHSEIVKEVSFISSAVFSCEDKPTINDIVARYEENHPNVEVIAPDILAANTNDGKWFERKREIKQADLQDGYFERYKRFLRRADFDEAAIAQMEEDCAKILKQCANPELTMDVTERKKRGLVVGDVQSGKTSSYLGLINLACDYDYKIIVLLAGMTDSLRQQTQKRIDAGFIGAISDSIGTHNIRFIGVSDDAQQQVHYAVPLTNNENDFVKFKKDNLNFTSGDFNKPIVLVVKKNASVLKSLCEWLKPGKNNIKAENVLIIDDEADNASINTRKPECDPTKINGLIRDLYNNFPIASYVGYTATPFANIFINPEGDEGFKDLFPSDFIVLLNAPSNYFGAAKVFSFDGEKHSRLLRTLDESEPGFLPPKHKKDEVEFSFLPQSMKEAIGCFLINNVIRTIRGGNKKHRSMLINISVFNPLHTDIHRVVSEYINKIKNIIEQDSYKNTENFIQNPDMKMLYDLYLGAKDYLNDGIDYYKEIRETISWEDIKDGLYEEIIKFETVIINSKNKKNRFSYDDDKYTEIGARVIIIGGYVLSRGLTLEGLMISYFSRNSSAYDSLLQMCRWFGYRPGYEDLCRVYISHINIMNFRAVIDAVEDLKLQFREMIVKKLKPDNFGYMIQESPDTLETSLLITSRNKMYNTGEIVHVINYGGTYADTSKLYALPKENVTNINSTISTIKKISDECGLELEAVDKRLFLQGIDKKYICSLLSGLHIPYENTKFDVQNLIDYISNSATFGIWDIVVATGRSEKEFLGQRVTIRTFRKREQEKIIRIGDTNNRIIDPGIFSSGLNEGQLTRVKKHAELRVKINGKGNPENLTVVDYLSIEERNPLFVIYPMELVAPDDNAKEELSFISSLEGETVFLGFAIGFPMRETPEKMRYRANKVKIKEIEDSRFEPEIDEEFYDED